MSEGCREFIEMSLEDIYSEGNAGDIVLLASLKLGRFSEQWTKFDIDARKKYSASDTAQERRNKAINDNLEALKPLSDKEIYIVYEAPKPIFKTPTFRCAKWFNAGNPLCVDGFSVSRDELVEYRQPIMTSLETITSQLENSFIYDPFDVLCPEDQCNAFKEGKPLYFDGDHLSGYGNMVVYKDFQRFIDFTINPEMSSLQPQTLTENSSSESVNGLKLN